MSVAREAFGRRLAAVHDIKPIKEMHMATGIEINLSEIIRDLDALSDDAPTED